MSLLQSFLVLTVLASLANAWYHLNLISDPLCDEYDRKAAYTPSNERVLFVPRTSNYSQAVKECENLFGHLFYPKTTEDHKWFVQAIHHVNFRSGGTGKFWVSLIVAQSINGGPWVPNWLTETGTEYIPFINLPQQTIATGYEEVTNNQAFAVPIFAGAIYEFETSEYEAEYFVCVDPDAAKIKQKCDTHTDIHRKVRPFLPFLAEKPVN